MKPWQVSTIALGTVLAADQVCKGLAITRGLIFENKRFGIYLPAIFLIAFFLIFLKTKRSHLQLPLILIIAGGASNLIDFISRGAIIDYLHIIHFYFNLADIAILTGVLLIAWQEYTKLNAT